MNMILKLTVATAVMLGAAFGVAKAQEAQGTPPQPGVEEAGQGGMDGMDGMGRGGHHGKGGKHGRGGRGMHHMRIVDANGDGVIGEDEAASLAEFAFLRLDDNRDGSLTEAEFIAGPGGGHRGWFNWNSEETAAVEKLRKENFAKLDSDKDTKLSKTEFFADAKAKLAAADTDKDGKVTPWEFRASR